MEWDLRFKNKERNNIGNEQRFDKYLERYEKRLIKEIDEAEKEANLTYDLNTTKGEKAVRDLFYKNPHDDEQAELFERVLETAKKLNVEFRHALRDPYEQKNINKSIQGLFYSGRNSVRVKHNGAVDKNAKGSVLLHELIHGVSTRALLLKEQGKGHLLNKAQLEAIDEIEQIYKGIYEKADELGFEKYAFTKGDYGLKNTHEFLAELSNPVFREKLKKVGVFEKVVNAITKLIVGIGDKMSLEFKFKGNAYEQTKKALYKLIDNYDYDFGAKYETAKFSNIKMGSVELEKKYIFKDGTINENIVKKEAEPFRKLKFSFDNFKSEFPNGKVKTPLGEVNVGAWQFRKMAQKERKEFFGLVKPTLENPNFIVDFENTTFYFKPFKDDKGVVKFASVTKDRDGKFDLVSNYPMGNRKFDLIIRYGKLKYQK